MLSNVDLAVLEKEDKKEELIHFLLGEPDSGDGKDSSR